MASQCTLYTLVKFPTIGFTFFHSHSDIEQQWATMYFRNRIYIQVVSSVPCLITEWMLKVYVHSHYDYGQQSACSVDRFAGCVLFKRRLLSLS